MARATLLLVPLLWATYNPAMRFIYASDASPSPAELTAVRMLIALVPFSLVLLSVAKDEASRSRKDRRGSSSDGAKKRDVLLLARAGAELGFLNAAGTAFQAFGLERTSATRAGFLLSTINVLVPLGAALTGQKVKPAVFLGVGLACVGVFVSETSGLEPLFSQTVFARGESLAGGSVVAAASASGVVESAVDAFDFGAGDACCLAAAALYSAFTVRLGTYAARLNAAELSAAKALAMTALCVAWWGLERVCLGADAAGSAPASVSILWSCASAAGGFGGASAVAVWGAVAYSALAPGALANVLQTRGQSAVPAAEAQLIVRDDARVQPPRGGGGGARGDGDDKHPRRGGGDPRRVPHAIPRGPRRGRIEHRSPRGSEADLRVRAWFNPALNLGRCTCCESP